MANFFYYGCSKLMVAPLNLTDGTYEEPWEEQYVKQVGIANGSSSSNKYYGSNKVIFKDNGSAGKSLDVQTSAFSDEFYEKCLGQQIVDGILRENRIQLKNVQYTSNIQAIMGLVANGYGISFVFESHLNHRAETLPINCYSFGDPRTVCDFVAATCKGSYISRYAQEFIKVVREAV